MDKVAKAFGAILGGIAMGILLGGVLSYFIMLLWNGCLVPALNVVSPIGWLQAWGLSILCGLLFKTHRK